MASSAAASAAKEDDQLCGGLCRQGGGGGGGEEDGEEYSINLDFIRPSLWVVSSLNIVVFSSPMGPLGTF